jgi:hypothetical protein
MEAQLGRSTQMASDENDKRPEKQIVSEINLEEKAKNAGSTNRKIPGNLPYLTAHGTLDKALIRLIEASRPDRFNSDFLENVLKLTGGAARATIPLLKRMGFLSADGTPTELYARFRTEGGRGVAALQALRIGFPEIFKRSEYAHSVDDTKLTDIIVEITGLKANDSIVRAIKSTFSVVRKFVTPGAESAQPDEDNNQDESPNTVLTGAPNPTGRSAHKSTSLGIAYNINIVLPETSDLRVLNAIFRSIKENLMQ